MNKQHPLQAAIDSIGNAIDKAIIVAVEDEAPDLLLARLAEARGGVVRADLITHVIDVPGDQPRVYADEARKLPPTESKSLPPIRKQPKHKNGVQRPGINKLRRSPQYYTCPSCEAEPNTACFYMTGPGHQSAPTDRRRDDGWMHTSRAKLAAEYNRKVAERYDKEHFA